jgi:glycerol-3-phosphate dehydrogenase (NAD(P)+)
MGMSLGENAKSALIARSFAEIIRLGNILGANPKTLFGLSGLGDLILTCNSLKSRNTSFGHLISSQPKVSITEHLQSLDTTEGYFTVQAIHNIAQEKNVNMPIANSIYRILFEKVSINDEINKLLKRPTKDEIY